MSVEQSVIHDIGYQRYQGPRLGRGYATRALFVHGLRSAYGLGRSAKAKIFPWFVVGVVALVAAVLVAVRSQTGQVAATYAEFAENMLLLLILFCAVVAPELVSRDLRNGVLPLYFSRPMQRSDYALAKLAALIISLWLLVGGPQVLMFIGSAFIIEDLSLIWDEVGDLLPGLAYSGLYAIVFGSLSLLVASLASRRAVAAAVIVGVFLSTTPIVGVLTAVGGQTARELAALASPLTLVGGVGDWLFEPEGASGVGDFGPLYGASMVALVILCVTLLLARYRSVAR